MSAQPVFHGIPTALRQSGRADGVPCLAVHGFAADMSVWMLVEPALRETCTLTMLDLPGHGATAPVLPTGGLDGFGAHLSAVLDSLTLGPVWLLAHSFGAAVAIRAAALDPSRVAGVLLIAPAGLGAEVDADFVNDLCAAADATTMRATLGRMLSRPGMITPAMAQSVFVQMQDPERGAALRSVAALLPGLQAALAPDLAAMAHLPVHIIRGTSDAIIAPDAALPDCWQRASLHQIDGAGHLPQLESPASTLAAIRAAMGVP